MHQIKKKKTCVHRRSCWKLIEVLRSEQTQNEQVDLVWVMRRYGQAAVSRMSPVDSVVLDLKCAGYVSATWYR
jgi:hypothetical protein